MIVLLLVFVAATFAENLLLVLVFDREAMPGIAVPRMLIATNAMFIAVFAMLALPSIRSQVARGMLDYSAALAFVLTALVVSRSAQLRVDAAGRSKVPGAVVASFRFALPFVVANAVTLAFAGWSPPEAAGVARAASFCLVATIGFLLACVVFPPLERRVESSNFPSILSGTPITVLTAMLMALAVSGLPG